MENRQPSGVALEGWVVLGVVATPTIDGSWRLRRWQGAVGVRPTMAGLALHGRCQTTFAKRRRMARDARIGAVGHGQFGPGGGMRTGQPLLVGGLVTVGARCTGLGWFVNRPGQLIWETGCESRIGWQRIVNRHGRVVGDESLVVHHQEFDRQSTIKNRAEDTTMLDRYRAGRDHGDDPRSRENGRRIGGDRDAGIVHDPAMGSEGDADTRTLTIDVATEHPRRGEAGLSGMDERRQGCEAICSAEATGGTGTVPHLTAQIVGDADQRAVLLRRIGQGRHEHIGPTSSSRSDDLELGPSHPGTGDDLDVLDART